MPADAAPGFDALTTPVGWTDEAGAPVRHRAYPDLPTHLQEFNPADYVEPTISWDAEDL